MGSVKEANVGMTIQTFYDCIIYQFAKLCNCSSHSRGSEGDEKIGEKPKKPKKIQKGGTYSGVCQIYRNVDEV